MTENTQEQVHYFAGLTPDMVLSAVESRGWLCTGSQLALNSYENRVYQVGIEDSEPLVVKFYRDRRWSDQQILEEHLFTLALADLEIPVVAPLVDDQGNTLFEYRGFRFALYPRKGGDWPELGDSDTLRWMGRFMARIHLLGEAQPFASRPAIDVESWGDASVEFLRQGNFLPPELESSYFSVAADVLALTRQRFSETGNVQMLRLHGDCHPGNILWTPAGPHFVDFDDARNGPAIQDLWMLLSGDAYDQEAQISWILEGYREFRPFDMRELQLIEPLRALRMLHYSAWLARRWDDPAFPHNFPWFNSIRYWEEQVLSLREQQALLQEPPLFNI